MPELYISNSNGIQLSTIFKPIEPNVTGHLPEEEGVYISILKEDCTLPTNRKIVHEPYFAQLLYKGTVYKAIFVGRTRNLNEAFHKNPEYSHSDHASLRKRIGALLGITPHNFVLQAGKARKTFSMADEALITDWLYENTFLLYKVDHEHISTQKMLSRALDTPLNLIPQEEHRNDSFREDLNRLLRRYKGHDLRSTWISKGEVMHAGPWLDAIPPYMRSRKMMIFAACIIIILFIIFLHNGPWR